MEPKEDFFLKNYPVKILHLSPGESISLGIRNASASTAHDTTISRFASLFLEPVATWTSGSVKTGTQEFGIQKPGTNSIV